jgi:hypothetical protein
VILDSTDVGEGPLTLTPFETPVSCPDSSYGGEAVEGGELAFSAEAITIVPELAGVANAEGLKATVHMNGCATSPTSGCGSGAVHAP